MLCYLAGMEPYYIKCIKDDLFQPKTAEGDDKPESQWTPNERRVVVQDQRLKRIIMSCLPDDIIESVISCEIAKATWNDLVYSLKGLRNANHTQTLDLADIYRRFIYEDNLIQRSQADQKVQKDYKVEYKKIKAKLALLEENPSTSQTPKTFQPKNKGLVAETFDWDEEEVSDDEEVNQVKVLMALADDELTVGKNHARNGEWIDITMRKKKVLGGEMLTESSSKMNENKNLSVPASMGILVPESQAINESLKPTKTSNTPEPSKDSEMESLTPLPPLKNLQGALPSSEVNSTQKTQESNSQIQQTESSKSVDSSKISQDSKPKVQNTSSSKSLRLKPIQKPQLKCELCHYTNHSTDECYRILYCMICKREDYRTSSHEMYTASLKMSENYKAQPYQYASSSKQILKAKVKPFPPCTHCGFNDHRHDDCRNYPECGIYRRISQNFSSPYTPEQNGVAEKKNRTLIKSARIMLNGSVLSKHFWTEVVRIASFRIFNTRRQQVEETYHVTFAESMKAIRFTNTSQDEIGIDDSSRYPPDEFLHEDNPSRQYQVDSNVLYCVIPHGLTLTKLTQENLIPEVIASNEPDIRLTENNEGPPDLINTEGTHEQNVYNKQITTQPTEGPSGNNTKISVSINESSVPDVPRSHISNQASTTSHPAPQDRWSKDQHIELVNIIGDPSEGMLIRSMAAKLAANSTSKCLFTDFLSEIKPKKVSEAMKHP
ncbi:retrovirus-related pol polyprotein from transposon TNT 1-94 [Tanacetum coccineum]